VLALGLASCSKNESATSTTEDANKAARVAKSESAKAADTAKAETARVADAANAEAAKTADAVKAEAARTAEAARVEAAKVEAARVEAARVADAAKVEAARAADNAKTQGFIDKAKSLIAEGKLSDASTVLQQLAGLSLSSDQQKLVDALKEQIQKALAAKAAEKAAASVGDLLKK
jgi:hypothetical protein